MRTLGPRWPPVINILFMLVGYSVRLIDENADKHVLFLQSLWRAHFFIRADHRFYNLYGVYSFLFAGMFINSLFENTIFLFDDFD